MVVVMFLCVFFFKQKTAYEMRISDWSSDVCSSDLAVCIPPVTHFVTLFLRERHLVVVIGQNVVRTVVHVLVPENFDQRSPCQEAGTKGKRDLGDTVNHREIPGGSVRCGAPSNRPQMSCPSRLFGSPHRLFVMSDRKSTRLNSSH